MSTGKLSGEKESHHTAPSRLKQERERRGWSQSELAEHIGTTQVNISRWETGLTSPGPYFRQQLAHVFDKSLEELGLVAAETPRPVEAHKELETTGSVAAPDTLRKPLWRVPYRQNPYFTGREELLSQLYTELNRKQAAALTQTQAISGLGGVGKTQIALEYAYRHREEYPAVFWLDASSRDIFKDEFAGLADLLNLPERIVEDQEIIISAVKRWLANHEKWLLIFDNIDELGLIEEFLPTESKGNVLITTRRQALGTLAHSISVDKMEDDEGKLLLLRRSKLLKQDGILSQARPDALAKAQEIVTLLGSLPLALDQAGAYIEETRSSFSTFLELYQKHSTWLLNRRGKTPSSHPEPVTTTWSLSFQNISKANPAAVELLYFFAFLSVESIYEEMLVKGADELGPTLSPMVADPLTLNEMIELLLRYSLLQRNPEQQFLSMHRLVQAVLRDEMDQSLKRLWAARATRAINKAFPEVDQSTWEECRRSLPHALLCLLHIKKFDLAFPEAATILNKTAAYLIDHAQYKEAGPLLIQAVSILERIQRDTHPDRARTLNHLGTLYLIQGNYKEAEPLLQEALSIRQQVLGPVHGDTTVSLTSLAQLYQAQGRYRDAESLFERALHIRRQLLEPGHPDITRSQSNLAKLYIDLGRYRDAEHMFLEARILLEQALGPGHHDVANLLNNLALVYRKMADYERAEELYVEALDLQEQVWGTEYEHPDRAEILNNMARLFRAQGRYEEAEPLYLKALNIRRNIFGPDHPNVAHSLYGLAKLYNSRGDFQLAEENGQKALSIQERHLGMKHPYVADTLVALAQIAQGQEDLDEAEQLNLTALTIQSESTGEYHPRVALINNNLAEIYHLRGQYPQAQPWIQKALTIHKQSLGEDHPYMAYSLTNQAENAFGLGDHEQAENLYLQALKIREDRLGSHHPRTLSSLRNMVKFYTTIGRHDKAEEYKKKILVAQEANSAYSGTVSRLPYKESS